MSDEFKQALKIDLELSAKLHDDTAVVFILNDEHTLAVEADEFLENEEHAFDMIIIAFSQLLSEKIESLIDKDAALKCIRKLMHDNIKSSNVKC